MTDLPRFHKGSIGPLDYSTINEMMARLDAVLPALQQAGFETTFKAKRLDAVMLVQYKLFSDPIGFPDLVGRYEWREIILRGEPLEGEDEFPDAGLQIDYPVLDDDEDFEQISAKVEYRYGTVVEEGAESDSYAVLIANPVPEGQLPPPTPAEGVAVCFSLIRHDGAKRYALLPLSETAEAGEPPITPKLVRLGTLVGEGRLARGNGEFIFFNRYNCNRLLTTDINPDGNGSQGGYNYASDEEWWDFSLHSPNAPTVTTGAALSLRTWDVGTIMVGIYLGAGVWANSCYPRYDVECS